MRHSSVQFLNIFPRILAIILLAGLGLGIQGCSSDAPLKPWLTVELTEEFTADMVDDQVSTFGDYLKLEDRLFKQLDDEVYAETETGPAHLLERYSRGSAADPESQQPNWNRSYELPVDAPVGGVLLLHGLSDSPYSLRSLGQTLNARGYWVIGLRLPGHGTAPSGLRHMRWQDMAAAVKLAATHLTLKVGTNKTHIIGYSTGAPLALNFALNAIEDQNLSVPSRLILISPAIRVHPTGALAGFKDSLAKLPWLDNLAYLTVMDEFDPYKYNSFATNAAAQVHKITRNVDRRIRTLSKDSDAINQLPPILVLKSTVDSTVTTKAVVDNLLSRLPTDRNELVLFDINRNEAIKSTLLVNDPGPLTRRLLDDNTLPFSVTFITNEDPHSRKVVARHKPPFSTTLSEPDELGLEWPRGVVSLSHVALPIAFDDPIYGQNPSYDDSVVFLGDLGMKGERGLLKIPADWLLRLRYNPFYPYLEARVLRWLNPHNN